MNKLTYKIGLFFFTILLFSITQISCTKDSSTDPKVEETGTYDAALVGSWELTKILKPIATTPAAVGIALTAVFNSDGTIEFTTTDASGPTVDTGTWSTSNGIITIKITDSEAATSAYTVAGNTATIDSYPVLFQGNTLLATLEFTKI